ncbi:MAG: hypothetical protein ACFFD1_13060 [Candidatus Thorarchaeota archaeon]
MQDIGTPLYFQVFGEEMIENPSDEFILGFLASVASFSQVLGQDNFLKDVSLDTTKIFFDYLPRTKYFVCIGVESKYLTPEYLPHITAFMSDLRNAVIDFFSTTFSVTKIYDNYEDYNYYFSSVILDKLYHKHFSTLSCLLYPNADSPNICPNSVPDTKK